MIWGVLGQQCCQCPVEDSATVKSHAVWNLVQERVSLGSGQPQDVAPDVVLLQMCSCKLMVGWLGADDSNMFMPC
jgi:hypothetical protein